MNKTLFDKLWALHTVADLANGESLLQIDRIFLHERTGGIALQSLSEKGFEVRLPAHVFCTMDHIVDTFPGRGDKTLMPNGREFIETTRAATKATGVQLFDIGDPRQGIVHVVAAEQGIVLPGLTLVCPDSHSCTLGGLGALAWGIGSTDAEHALVTGTLRVRKPRNMRVRFEGKLPAGTGAKDMMLNLISQYSAMGGNGYAVEFTGPCVLSLPVESRMTLCNMAVEFSAFTGLIAVDEKTIEYIQGRTYAPAGEQWELATENWKTLHSNPAATFDKELVIDGSCIQPTVTWGTSPQHAVAINGVVPDPAKEPEPDTRKSMFKAQAYMGLSPGTCITDIPIDAAFIGSCTNARLADLRQVAGFLKGKHVDPCVRAIVVPGSTQIKHTAESEGLDRIFSEAGFEWRESGCSMCFYAGGETFGAGKRVISSTNRNFEGRQGPGTRTHLASPLTVAASAVEGFIRQATTGDDS